MLSMCYQSRGSCVEVAECAKQAIVASDVLAYRAYTVS